MENSAAKAIQGKISGVESEQGDTKSIGAEPNENFGHKSAPSAGVSGQIPVGGGE